MDRSWTSKLGRLIIKEAFIYRVVSPTVINSASFMVNDIFALGSLLSWCGVGMLAWRDSV